jgi:hypothetical protein
MVCYFTGMRSWRVKGKLKAQFRMEMKIVMVGKMLNLREGGGVEGKKKVNGLTHKHTLNPLSRHCP